MVSACRPWASRFFVTRNKNTTNILSYLIMEYETLHTNVGNSSNVIHGLEQAILPNAFSSPQRDKLPELKWISQQNLITLGGYNPYAKLTSSHSQLCEGYEDRWFKTRLIIKGIFTYEPQKVGLFQIPTCRSEYTATEKLGVLSHLVIPWSILVSEFELKY